MAFSPSFTCKYTPNTSHKILTSLTYVSSQTLRRNQHTPRVKVVIPNPIFGITNVRKCIISYPINPTHQKKPAMKCKFTEKSDFLSYPINPASVSDVIDIFRVCINNKKNTEQLKHLISSDCCIDDSYLLGSSQSSSPTKTQTKEQVMDLLREVAAKIDEQKLQFKFEVEICKEEELAATVNWKLVGNEPQQKPKFEGSSKVYCSKEEGDKLVIRKLKNTIYKRNVSIKEDETDQELSSSPEQS